MLHRIKSCRLSSKEFNAELDELLDYANKLEQLDLNNELKRLQGSIEKYTKHENEKNNSKKCEQFEKEALNLIEELKTIYEDKIAKIKQHYEKQFVSLVQKHKSDIQLFRSKIHDNGLVKQSDTTKSPKKLPKNDNHDNQSEIKAERKRLNDKIDELEKENKRLKLRIESAENRIEKNEKQRKTIESDLGKSKQECNDLNGEIAKQKSKIIELEKTVEKQKAQLSENETKIGQLKEINEKLEKQLQQSKIESLETPIKSISTTEVLSVQNNHNDNGSISSGIGGVYSVSDNDNYFDDIEKLKTKLIISERDIRLANRKIENKTEICNILRSDLKEIKQQLTECEKKLMDEQKRSNNYSDLITTYESELNQNKQQIEQKDTEIMNLKLLIDENNNHFNLKLKESNENEKKLRQQYNDANKRIDLLMKEIETCKRNNVNLNYSLEKTTNEMNRHMNDNEQLKKKIERFKKLLKCCEEQISEYNQKLPNIINKQKLQTSDQISILNQELNQLKEKNKLLQNEIEELQSKLIEQQKHMNSMIENEKIENNHLKNKLSLELMKIDQYEMELSELKLILDNREEELIAIKEEAANHITKISKLSQELLEYQSQNDIKQKELSMLYERHQSLQDNFDEKCQDLYLYEETISQQKKLLDYINENCKCLNIANEKKKSFTLFSLGSINKQNSNQQKSPIIDELQRKLKNEYTKNELLNKKLNEIVQELDKRCRDVQKLRCEIQILKSKNHEKTPQSVGGEHHFVSKLMKTNYEICVACAKMIKLGSKAKLCKECRSIIHNGCRLLNNCGISVEMIRSKSFGVDEDDDDDTTKNYHQHQNQNDEDNDNDSIFPESTTTPTDEESDINSVNTMY